MNRIREITMKFDSVNDDRKYYFFYMSNLSWSRCESSVRFLADFIVPNAKVLEVGCGLGHTAVMLADMRPDIEIIGTDIKAVNTWEYFRQEFNCLFKECDATKLPFNPEEFDAVVSFGVMEHVADQGRFLKEIHRCLKKGGYNIIFKLPNKYSLPQFLSQAIGLAVHEKKYSLKEAIGIIENAGFKALAYKREHLIPSEVDRLSSTLGKIFNKIYKPLFKLDAFVCKTFLSLFSQNIRVISQKI